ncbi:MAG: FRG domain-containing protein [Treponemataceae bacterium]|nr:FRG domain-containing protein [Treponemataceae bacterium]
MIKQIGFEEHRENGKLCYHEATLRLDGESTYLQLFDIYLRPKDVLADCFDRIFPKEQKGHTYHSIMTMQNDFRPWNGWVFRGQAKSSYRLKPSFERMYFDKKEILKDLFKLEQGIIRDFKRNVRAFYPEYSSIKDNDIYEYMSLVQHFGGATRFLDATFSFFIALFFAIGNIELDSNEKSTEGKYRQFSIWCFDRVWIEYRYKDFLPPNIIELYDTIDKFGKDPQIQEEVLNYIPNMKKSSSERNERYKTEFRSVINMNPFNLNSRINRQKGLFLMPTNPYCTFEDNLFNMVQDEDDSWHILKINVEYDNNALLHMQKCLDAMNINHFVLFENLDGMCRNINMKACFPDDSITIPPSRIQQDSSNKSNFDL